MSELLTQRELRNESGRIMRQLDEGKSFVVTRNSLPVGELRPLHRRRLVDSRLVMQVFRGAPQLDAAAFRRDVDAIAEQSPEPRG